MHNLEISCFGSLEIRKDGRIIERFETEKSRALLIYLALENKKRFPRSHLAGLFWSDLSERQALQCLRQTLSLLRKAFDEDGKNQRIILSDHDSVRLNPDIPSGATRWLFNRNYQALTTIFNVSISFKT
jgi:DNA-binding SARP family transcriptional activator